MKRTTDNYFTGEIRVDAEGDYPGDVTITLGGDSYQLRSETAETLAAEIDWAVANGHYTEEDIAARIAEGVEEARDRSSSGGDLARDRQRQRSARLQRHRPCGPGSSKESAVSYTAKQMVAIAEFCGYATKVNPEGDRIHPHQLIIHEKLHNDDSTDGRLDLTVVALTSEIVVRATIDCYGNVSRSYGLVEWVHSDDWEDGCNCSDCELEYGDD